MIWADTIEIFKNRLDKFWKNQDMVYDYKCDLTGIGNRSLTNMDLFVCPHPFVFPWAVESSPLQVLALA